MRQSYWRKLAVIAAVVYFVAAWLAAAPAQAQTCGSPPDPRSNSLGYSNWCSCMGGSYNIYTTACTGATGPKRPGGAASGGNNWPAQHWYCRARASNGASGWARYGDREAAERSALSHCDNYAKGRACRITGCSYVGGTPPAEQQATPSYSAPPPPPPATAPLPDAAPPFGAFRQPTATCGGRKCMADQICGPTNKCYDPSRHFYCGTTQCVKGRNYRPGSACGACGAQQTQAERAVPHSPFPFAAVTCEQCYRKLKNDIRFGWMTQRPRTYIAGAISGYAGCKQKASGSCTGADNFRKAIGGCAASSFNEEGSRGCVSHVLKSDPGDF